MSILHDFTTYLKKHNVIALAVGVMIATSLSGLTNSLVENIIKPLLDPVINSASTAGNIDKWEIKKGPFHLKIGKFVKQLIDFLIVGLVIVTLSNFASKTL